MNEQKDKCPDCENGLITKYPYDRDEQPYEDDCPTCNGTGEKKLDRPDREKAIFDLLTEACGSIKPEHHLNILTYKIIALFPDIEELMKTNKALGLKLMEYSLKHKEDLLDTKREERERIIGELERRASFHSDNHLDYMRLSWGDWQALKNNKEETHE